jgi:hypothetical protein
MEGEITWPEKIRNQSFVRFSRSIPGCQRAFATVNMPPCVMNHFDGEFP